MRCKESGSMARHAIKRCDSVKARGGGLICRIPTSIYTLRFKNTSACTCIHSNFKAISCVKRGLMKQTLSLCCVCLQTRVLCSGGKFC